MKHFTIENETNNITVYGSAKEADAVPNDQRFSSEAALGKLAADWPATRLVEIWNSLPGETPVKKFKDRATGVARIWSAIQNLAVTGSEAPTERNDVIEEAPIPAVTSAEADATGDGVIEASEAPTEPVTGTPVAQQDAHVAPETLPSGHTASPPENAPTEPAIDRSECERLLGIAGETQTAYWNALRDLERALGFEIDDPGDLREATVDELLAHRKPARKPRAPRAAGTTAPRENSKTNQVIAMLKRPEGATLEEIMTAMNWQKHTTRAMLSAGGSLVKNHGLTVTSEIVGETKRFYIKD